MGDTQYEKEEELHALSFFLAEREAITVAR
jgi:hypothetical protein